MTGKVTALALQQATRRIKAQLKTLGRKGVVDIAWGRVRGVGGGIDALTSQKLMLRAIEKAGWRFAQDDSLPYLLAFSQTPELVKTAQAMRKRLGSTDIARLSGRPPKAEVIPSDKATQKPATPLAREAPPQVREHPGPVIAEPTAPESNSAAAASRAPASAVRPSKASASPVPTPTVAAPAVTAPAKVATGPAVLMQGQHLTIALNGSVLEVSDGEESLPFDMNAEQVALLQPLLRQDWAGASIQRVEEFAMLGDKGSLAVALKPYRVRELTLDDALSGKKTAQTFMQIRERGSKTFELIFKRFRKDPSVKRLQEVVVPISEEMFETLCHIHHSPLQEKTVTPYSYRGETVKVDSPKGIAKVAFTSEATRRRFIESLETPDSWLTVLAQKPTRGRPTNASRLASPENPSAAWRTPSGSD